MKEYVHKQKEGQGISADYLLQRLGFRRGSLPERGLHTGNGRIKFYQWKRDGGEINRPEANCIAVPPFDAAKAKVVCST